MAKKVGGFKKIIAMAYGLGAAVVILGALFKIMHWPGADEMLIAGMGTEVLIFLISAFEPTYEEYQWERVYPHLMDENSIERQNINVLVNQEISRRLFYKNNKRRVRDN